MGVQNQSVSEDANSGLAASSQVASAKRKIWLKCRKQLFMDNSGFGLMNRATERVLRAKLGANAGRD